MGPFDATRFSNPKVRNPSRCLFFPVGGWLDDSPTGPFHLGVVQSSISVQLSDIRNERQTNAKGFSVSTREIQDQKAITRQMFVQPAAQDNWDVSASPHRADTISGQSRCDYTLGSMAEGGSREPADISSLSITS